MDQSSREGTKKTNSKVTPNSETLGRCQCFCRSENLPQVEPHLTEESVLFECFADGAVGAWVGGARVDRRLTVIPSVAGPAQAGEIAWARFVSAHGTVGARVGVAVRVLDQALQAGKSLGTVTP